MKNIGLLVIFILISGSQIQAQQIPTTEPEWFSLADNDQFIYEYSIAHSFDAALVGVLQSLGHKIRVMAFEGEDSIIGTATQSMSTQTDTSYYGIIKNVTMVDFGEIKVQGIEQTVTDEKNSVKKVEYTNFLKILFKDASGGTMMIDASQEFTSEARGEMDNSTLNVVSQGPTTYDIVRYIESDPNYVFQHTVRLDKNGAGYNVYMQLGITRNLAEKMMEELRNK